MFNPSCLTHSGFLHRSQWMPACCEPLPPEDRRTPFSRTPISRTTQTRLVIASGNPHKVAEIAAMLEMVELEVLPQPAGLEIEETGSTYAANARLKAETVARLTGCWALADDSGLEVMPWGTARASTPPAMPPAIRRRSTGSSMNLAMASTGAAVS